MNRCPIDELGITECERRLIKAAAQRGKLIRIHTQPPDDLNDLLNPRPAVSYICEHGTRYWVTPFEDDNPQQDFYATCLQQMPRNEELTRRASQEAADEVRKHQEGR